MSFWTPNIGKSGRIARISGGIIFLLAAALLLREDLKIPAIVCALAGAFMLFEGFRGWCVLRACKIKTPL